MLESLFTAPAATAETRGHLSSTLHPEEAQLIGDSAEKRRQEFQTGRACARQALERLGVAPVPILAGDRGEPLWPVGIVGSITHCSVYRACAVARTDDLISLGIDAEPNLPLPDGVLARIAFGPELEVESSLTGVCVDRLLFCAKEAIFKAWFPLNKKWLGFEDTEVTIDVDGRTFAARLLNPDLEPDPAHPHIFHGRWAMEEGVICTTVEVPAPLRD
ncbi:MAG TPA: 4'-phosphopantetheinyl transferase superfamily protein [Solirubrobacteraceae bacterium]|jgi:4'-phosphopantetheinyl transferase EntD|nr:4'-phosphopantetheinyl transferase superfamily protein [Solirubrobacteraceae bacterium]